jgi:hypothetical protein
MRRSYRILIGKLEVSKRMGVRGMAGWKYQFSKLDIEEKNEFN